MIAAKTCRKSLGLSQIEFADRFGLQRDTYRQWERGRRRPDQASQVLLHIIAHSPDMVAEAVRSLRPVAG